MSGLSGRPPRRSAGTIVVPVITGPLDARRTRAAWLDPKHAFPGGNAANSRVSSKQYSLGLAGRPAVGGA